MVVAIGRDPRRHGSAALLDDIREALAELGTGGAPVLTKDDALRLIADR